jgi:preprotein translocase SecE subunit
MTNPIKATIGYFQGVSTEMRKVTWPTVSTVVQHFISVVLGVAFFVVFVGVADFLFFHLLGILIK